MPASDLIKAADDITWLGNRFQGLLKGAEAIKQLGSLENAIAEAQGRLADLAKQEEAAKTRVLQIIAEAKGDAGKVAKKAADDYAAVMAAAKRDADSVKADSDKVAARHAELTAHVANLEEAIVQRTADHALVLGKIEEATGEHSRIQKLIADLKAKIAA